MKSRTVIATAFSLLMLVGTVSAARAQGHTIRGKIRNSAGANVGRASVTLERNGAMIDQTVANNEGDFNFGGLSETSYTVVVNAPDYNPASESVEFVRGTSPDQPGESRTVEIVLLAKGGVRAPRAGLNFVQDVPKAARDAFESGIKFAREKNATQAVASYENAIRIFPDYFDAHFILANELARQGRLPDAISHLDQARRVQPNDDRVYDLFARVLMQQRKFAVAARVYAEAARLNPAEALYLVSQGTALIEQAASINPHPQSKAVADERSFAFAEAERVLKQASKQNKNLADVHLQLARLYEKMRDPGHAAEELEAYLRKAPNAKNAEVIRGAIKVLRAAQDQRQ